jgi:hypothetical protein
VTAEGETGECERVGERKDIERKDREGETGECGTKNLGTKNDLGEVKGDGESIRGTKNSTDGGQGLSTRSPAIPGETNLGDTTSVGEKNSADGGQRLSTRRPAIRIGSTLGMHAWIGSTLGMYA